MIGRLLSSSCVGRCWFLNLHVDSSREKSGTEDRKMGMMVQKGTFQRTMLLRRLPDGRRIEFIRISDVPVLKINRQSEAEQPCQIDDGWEVDEDFEAGE